MSPNVTAGLDGTPEGLAAAEWAAREATLRELPLRLIHAWKWQPYTYAPLGKVAPPPGAEEPESNWARHMLEEARAQLLSRYPELEIGIGEVADESVPALLAAAEQADVLALGSRGLGRVTGYLLGSVSLAVVARTERPVVLVRATDHDQKADVVLGLDMVHSSEPVIEFAFEAAARRGARVLVVHNWALGLEYFGREHFLTPAARDRIYDEVKGRLAESLRPWLDKFPDVAVTERAATGRAGSSLVEASHGAALVVVGRQKNHPAFGAHIGPITQAVLHHAHSPVAVIAHD